MEARKFELFMCCLGNGITVCNKAVYEYGDYKHVAHIGDNGKISWYVSENYVPEDAKRRIETTAENQRKEYLEQWNKLSVYRKYEKLLDMVPLSDFLEVVRDNSPLESKVARLEAKYL